MDKSFKLLRVITLMCDPDSNPEIKFWPSFEFRNMAKYSGRINELLILIIIRVAEATTFLSVDLYTVDLKLEFTEPRETSNTSFSSK